MEDSKTFLPLTGGRWRAFFEYHTIIGTGDRFLTVGAYHIRHKLFTNEIQNFKKYIITNLIITQPFCIKVYRLKFVSAQN